MVPIWRSTQAGRTVLLFQALLLRLGLRLVSDNTDLSGAEIHRVTAKHNPSQNRRKEEERSVFGAASGGQWKFWMVATFVTNATIVVPLRVSPR